MKRNHQYEIFIRHGVREQEIDFLFDMKKVMRMYPDIAFPETRINAEINVAKGRKLKVIFEFDPFVNGKRAKGEVGIITAFYV